MQHDHRRPRLGRGLASLIRNSTASQPPGQYEPQPATAPSGPTRAAEPPEASRQSPPMAMLPVSRIEPNPYQPRRDFDPHRLRDLAQSLRTHGLLQPILVTELPDPAGGTRYSLIAGERRLRAAQLAGLLEIPCIVRSASRPQRLELALVENLHRADLNPIERASAYRDLIDRFGLTQQEVADGIGQPRTTVANYLRLLELADPVQLQLISGDLTFGHAKVLASLAGQSDAQAALAARTVREGLSVRQLERLVRQQGQRDRTEQTKEGQTPKARSAYLTDLQAQLSEAVGTKVRIHPGRSKHTGRVVIEYYGLDDFDRIIAALGATIDS